jgi:heme exporter protein D
MIEAGHYAAFVWPAYLVTAGGFAWMIIDTLVRARAWRRKVEALEQAREAVTGGQAKNAP